MKSKCCYSSHLYFYHPALFCILAIAAANAFAITANDVVVATAQDQAIVIDVSGGQTAITVSITTPPQHGTAQIDGMLITYTPAAGFAGEDQLVYQAADELGSDTGTITIRVNPPLTEVGAPPPDTPSAAVETTLVSICGQDVPQDVSPDEQALLNRCNEFSAATTAEANTALKEIAPEEVAAQGQTGNAVAVQQLRNIGNRLAAVRRGATGTGFGQVALQLRGVNLPVHALQDLLPLSASGGGASADEFFLPSRWGFFISGTLGKGDREQSAKEEGFNFDTNSATTGLDYRFSRDFVVGAALGYADSSVEFASEGGGVDLTGISSALYGTYYQTDQLYFETVLTYVANHYQTTRTINYQIGDAEAVNATATGESNSALYGASLGAGYELGARDGLATTLSLRVDYLNSVIDPYAETGANEFNLIIDQQELESLASSLNVQVTYAASFSWGVMVPQLDIAWEHEFKGDAVPIRGSFAADRTQAIFIFDTDEADPNYARAALGLSVVLPRGATAFVQYEKTLLKEHFSDYYLSLGARLELPF